jgi:hypothetical protein
LLTVTRSSIVTGVNVVTVVLVVAVLVVLVVVGLVVRGARRQGVESELSLRTHDELSEQHLAAELGDQVYTGVDVDGRLSGDAIPEPGPPPVHGAQWDEHAGRWIHWDPGADRWVPLPPTDGA